MKDTDELFQKVEKRVHILERVDGLFKQAEKKISKLEEIRNKEQWYVTPDDKWSAHLWFYKYALWRKWRVAVAYNRDVVISKGFRKYEDALDFYKVVVEYLRKKYEKPTSEKLKGSEVIRIRDGHYVVEDDEGNILYVAKDSGDALQWAATRNRIIERRERDKNEVGY